MDYAVRVLTSLLLLGLLILCGAITGGCGLVCNAIFVLFGGPVQ